MQLESFLSHQRSLEEGQKTSNGHTLFGTMKIPTGNHIRPMLDPVHPSHLQGPFDQAVAKPRAHGGMRAFERLDGRALIAIEGTGYFRSYKPGCLHCLTRKRSNGGHRPRRDREDTHVLGRSRLGDLRAGCGNRMRGGERGLEKTIIIGRWGMNNTNGHKK